MKKLLSLLLCFTLLLGASAQISLAEELEPVVIRVLSRLVDSERSSLDDEVGRMIYDALKIEIRFIPFNESNYEKAQMMLAAQNWGDLDMVNTAMNEITSQYIASDAFVNLDDYRDIMPNFYNYCADLIPYWRNFDAEEGNLYVWQNGPDQLQMTQPCLDIVVRTDVLEALGWPDLDTTDDYIEFLKRALEIFPESNGQPSIGMSCFFGDAVGTLVSTYLPRHSGFSDAYKTTCMIDVENQQFIPKISHPYYKETAKFFNTLYQEGILDPEIWTDGFNECQAKMDSGVALSVWFMNWVLPGANTNAVSRGQEDQQYIVMPVRLQIAEDEGRNTRYEIFTSYRADNTMGILKTSPNVERICQLLNFMATPEMALRCGWGQEGREYTVDADGKLVLTQEFLDILTNTNMNDYLYDAGINFSYSDFLPLRTTGLLKNGQAGVCLADPAYSMSAATERQREAYAALGWANNTSGWSDNKHFKFVPFDLSLFQAAVVLDAESDEGKIEAKITDYLQGAIPKLMSSNSDEEFEAQYAEMCAKCAELGEDRLIAKYNEQYKTSADQIEALKAR